MGFLEVGLSLFDFDKKGLISGMHKARNLPDGLQHAATLLEWDLSGQGLDALPQEVPPFPQLQRLDLNHNQLQVLPAWICDLPALTQLNVSYNRLSMLPSGLGRLVRLKRLCVDQNPLLGFPALAGTVEEVLANGCRMEYFPESLLECTALKSLSLSGNGMRFVSYNKELPARVDWLDLSDNQLDRFPAELLAKSRLSMLKLAGNPCVDALGGDRFAEVLGRFFADAAKAGLPLPDRACNLDILCDDHPRAADHPRGLLLAALDAHFRPVQAKAVQVLARVLENPLLKGQGGQVLWLGNFHLVRQAELKEKLAAAGYRTVVKIQGPETIVIAGQAPGQRLHQAVEAGCAVAVEGHLLQWEKQAQGSYLQAAEAGGHPMLEHQLQLLRSNEAANIRMAMMLMDGGGVPDAALPELLAIRCFHPDPELRALAAERWQPRASAGMREAVARAWQLCELEYNLTYDYAGLLGRLLLIPLVPEQTLIARALTLHGTGLQYVQRLPPLAQASLYQQRLRNGELRLNGLQLKAVPEGVSRLDGLLALNLSNNTLEGLPGAIGQLGDLHSLDLSSNQLRELPEQLGQLRKLVCLDLAGNRLQAWPEACCDLEALVALRLGQNPLRSLPPAFVRLTQLEYLSLRAIQQHGLLDIALRLPKLHELDLGDMGLEAVPEGLRALPLLEGLNLDHNPIGLLPDWLGDLPRLRHLDLSYISATRLPVGLRRLPRLERLYLLRDDSMDWAQVADILAGIPTLKELFLKRHRIVPEMERHLALQLGRVRIRWSS
jgi:Leucine-rich repeat (LRR) protein